MMKFCSSLTLITLLTSMVCAQTREEKVRKDRSDVIREGYWIYNDFNQAVNLAQKTGKPLLVTLRCIPCEECVKLDDEVLNRDPIIRPLLDQFVCVRLISTNGLDLSLFQFDYDQSFCIFLMNADKTIYGRFGTRSHRTNWVGDVSVPGLAKAMTEALKFHAQYPTHRDQFLGKMGAKLIASTPEQLPTLEGKYKATLDVEGKIVPSCIHCHQIGDALKNIARKDQEPFPISVLFPHPHPKTLGLILNPNECASVTKVVKGSIAEKAGFHPGDKVVKLADQPLLSIADFQWVLHQAPNQESRLTAIIEREGLSQTLIIDLPSRWKEQGDLSWRASTWGLRRMVTGGMLLESISPEDAITKNNQGPGLVVKHVGEYGKHRVAKDAGFRQGDILLAFNGRKDFVRESDLLAYALQNTRPGQRIDVQILRDGKVLTLKLLMQE